MALFKFTKAIMNEEIIDVANYGNHERDFTYIDDIIEELLGLLIIQLSQTPIGMVKIQILDQVLHLGKFIILEAIIH